MQVWLLSPRTSNASAMAWNFWFASSLLFGFLSVRGVHAGVAMPRRAGRTWVML